ncbi:MAG: HlyD family efflux transporter periplasmic adaptor subunit, partial [Arcobacteraceae bacterium]
IDDIELERIKNAPKSLKSIDVHSPINAIVMKKNVNNKSAITKGKTILELANIENLWFIAQVYQKDLLDIKVGMDAKIYIDGIDTPIKSKVDFIYPIVNNESKTIDVRFNIKNKDLQIIPNMFAVVKIETTKRPMLTLPKTAVLNKGNKFYVFKPLSDREFEPVEIQAKRISSSTYEILDGLEENDEVINNALFLLDSDAVTNALYDTDADDEW